MFNAFNKFKNIFQRSSKKNTNKPIIDETISLTELSGKQIEMSEFINGDKEALLKIQIIEKNNVSTEFFLSKELSLLMFYVLSAHINDTFAASVNKLKEKENGEQNYK